MTQALLRELQEGSRGVGEWGRAITPQGELLRIAQILPVQSEKPTIEQVMKAYEFSAHITADGKLELPDAALPRSLNNPTVRVISAA